MEKHEKKLFLCLAFFLPTATMLVLFIVNGIYPFGGRTFLAADLYHQYMPFFSELLHKLRGGEGLGFSFQVGIGSNFLSLFGYYLASPLHIFALLVPEAYLTEFISYLVVVKVGLCGLTCCIYFREHFETSGFLAMLCSLFYALSGFLAAYNYNIMWLDCIILLPLIILGLERLVKEGRCGLYCVTLALSIFTNFYLSIMICIFLVFYFVLLFLTEKRSLKIIGYFVLFSLLAGGMAAVLLIPEVTALLQTDFGDMDFPETVESYFSVLDMLARHFFCVSTERGLDHWPNIYCGSAVLMLVPMYVLDRGISIRDKFFRLALAGFLLLSFGTNLLDFLWHGMNYPDSLPARQSFLYIFLILSMCCDVCRRIKKIDPQLILYGFLAAVGFALFCEKFVEHEDFYFGVEVLTLAVVSVYAVLLYLYRTRESCRWRFVIKVMAVVVAVAELGGNMGTTSIWNTDRQGYLGQQADYRSLYESTREKEESLYRLEKFSRKTKNDGTLTGYPTASVFSSTMNSYVMDLYERLGMRHSKVYYSFDGATAFTSALLNVKYMFGDSALYENTLYSLEEKSGEVFLYRCNEALPFGYVAPVGFDVPTGFKNQGIQLQNNMVRQLGVTRNLFSKVYGRNVGDNVMYTASKAGIYYGILTASGTGKIDYIGGSTELETFEELRIGSILYLGYLEAGQTVTLKNGDETDSTPKISVDIYQMDERVLEEALASLSQQHLKNVSWESDCLSGELTLEQGGRLILSIPYEDGWTVLINGEEAARTTFGDCLMAFDLEPGEYHIEMYYVPAGLWAGVLVSAVSIVLFMGLMLLFKRHKKDLTAKLDGIGKPQDSEEPENSVKSDDTEKLDDSDTSNHNENRMEVLE